MKKRYEVLLALNTRGKEESSKEIIERLEKDFAAEGVTVEQVQRLERRELAYEHAHITSAYFVNFVISTEPSKLDRLRGKFKLDEDIALTNFIALSNKATAAAA